MAGKTGGGPKATFYIVLFLVVAGLAAYGLRDYIFPPAPDVTQQQIVTPPGGGGEAPGGGPEAADSSVVTTVKEYSFVPSEKLPPVKGVSNYSPMKDRTVKFALNVWAGWAPIILYNNGKEGRLWKTPDGQDFKVELVLMDDPVAMRDAYAAGQVHIGWGTLDMVPLFMEELQKDSRVWPRIYQQVDWSNGGDGIVFRRSHAKNPEHPTVADLKGKKVVLAQNSPSQFFLLNTLINAGVQPSEVDFVYTQDAFQAAAAFNADKNIAACVSWAPDIYTLTESDQNHLLVTTATANKLIADVWFARADFAKDNPDIIEGLVRGIFEGMEELKTEEGKKKAAQLMSELYNIPPDDCLAMLGDAHSTNCAENKEFFLNQNNPANFESTWNTANYLYRRVGAVTKPVTFDTVMDFSVLKALESEPLCVNSKDEYTVKFTPKSVQSIKVESGEILTKVVVLHFYPNSWDLNKMIVKKVDGKDVEEQYDPNVDFVLDEIAKLAAQYGAARIVIEGHTDASMKGKVPAQLVKDLAGNRANAVKEALINKYKTLDPSQFSTEGMGWDVPADANDPMNHAKNRRVEVKVFPLESSQ